MLELLGAHPRPVHPNQCGSLKGMTWPVGRERSQKIPLESALESSLKGSDDTLFYCGEFLYSSVNPAYCKPFAAVRRGSLGTAQSSGSTAKSELP